MKPCIVLLVFFFFASGSYAQQDSVFTPLPYPVAYEKADSIVQLMTLDEKIRFLGGQRFFYSRDIKRLDIPAVPFVDATQGIRKNPTIISPGFKQPLEKSIAYPAPILLASTWNRELAYNYAHSIGEECRAAALPVLLGPGLNIYRNSQCGRNFEYFGEDPYLAGQLVASYVEGLQETGTMATLKHFIANQTEYFRRKSNSLVDERSLHEIYMPAFKDGIDAGARAVMTSYNLVNGEWAGQSEYVISYLLREQLNYPWMVMTDWMSVWDGARVIKSGQDLEMPYRKATRKVKKLLSDSIISEVDIDRMARSTLSSLLSMSAFDREKKALSEEDYKRLEENALNTAREGMVLLKNEGEILPINKTKKPSILVTGFQLDKRIEGGGAAAVTGYNNLTVREALINEFGTLLRFIKEPSPEQIKDADYVLVSLGTRDREGEDRPFELPAEQEEKLLLCADNNPNTIALVSSGGGVQMSKWDKVPAILFTWYMGQNGATALAEILSGKVNPSGKLPISIEKDFKDSPAYGYIPENEKLYSGKQIKKEKHRAVYDIKYDEGILNGYRWYDSKYIEPEFCFGHGLSYTSYSYKELKIPVDTFRISDTLDLEFIIKNSGEKAGSEIVQLYVRDLDSSIPRPLKELKAFEKLNLEAGESDTIKFQLDRTAFQFWDPEQNDWIAEAGAFEIMIGASSRDIRLRGIVTLLE